MTKQQACILLVEDEESILQTTKRYLERSGFRVLIAKDGSAAYLIAQESSPNVIVTDADLPVMDGLHLCRILKRDARTADIPVIVISGKWTGEGHQVSGFDGGAEDYVLKPFSQKLLRARIEVALRRSQARVPEGRPIKSGGVELDHSARSIKANGAKVGLTRKEFDLLSALMSRPDRVLRSHYLLESVWGHDLADYSDTHTVQVHISMLRKKLGPKAGRHIVSVMGHGYKWQP